MTDHIGHSYLSSAVREQLLFDGGGEKRWGGGVWQVGGANSMLGGSGRMLDFPYTCQ